MQRILLSILLLILSCIDLEEITQTRVEGCTIETACNYNPDANSYDITYVCKDFDECGVCGGNGDCQAISVLQDFIDNSSATINMDMDDNGNGIIEPLELGNQLWVNGTINKLDCSGGNSEDWLPQHQLELEEHNCQLSGNIPTSIGSLTNLYYLNLADNQLTGAIPSEIGNMNLSYLYLSNNQLTTLP